MNAILICPSSRPAIDRLGLLAPLPAIPLLGESLLEYWLTALALLGVQEVRILANDRPAHIAALVGNGARWGIRAEVIAESRELTPAQAQIKYGRGPTDSAATDEIHVLDHFPGSAQPLFASYESLFAGLWEWLPNALTPDRVGVHESRPGIWTGLHTRISPDAQLHAPCWIGHSVYIGARAVVGPMAIVEDRSFVEPEAEITGSMVGPDTFVGQLAVIRDSFAWGSTLIDWKSNLCAQISDAMLLCALRSPALARPPGNVLGRLSEIYSRNKDELQMFWKHWLMNKEG